MKGYTTMSNNETSWVRNRAQCTIKRNLKVIADAVVQNTRTFNALNKEERHNRFFGHEWCGDQSLEIYLAEKGDDGTILYKVGEDDHQNYVVHISCSDACVIVYRKDLPSIEICPKWNTETLTCDLLIEGVVHSVWHICHKILCDILFDNQGQ